MWKKISYAFVATVLISVSAFAQNPLSVSDKIVARVGTKLLVSFKVSASEDAVRLGEKIYVSPMLKQLETGDSTLLNLFYVAGHQQEKIIRQQEKLSRSAGESYVRCIGNGDTFTFFEVLDYGRVGDVSMPETFELCLTAHKMTCCKVNKCLEDSEIFVVEEAVKPLMVDVKPNVSGISEQIKERYPFLRRMGTEAYASRGVSIRFPVSSVEIDPSLFENEKNLGDIIEAVSMVCADEWTELEAIDIAGYASPEGDTQTNMELSRRRAEALKTYITQKTGIKSEQIDVYAGGEDWARLRELVEASNISQKSEIIEIIDEVPVNERQTRLMKLENGKLYKTLLDEMYPKLRDACYINVWYSEKADVVAAVVNAAIEDVKAEKYQSAIEKLTPYKEDCRTWNVLGSAMLLLNDLETAKMWFSKAAMTGDADAMANLEMLN